ncbi:MAG: bile acid:sodium symporter family protein [Bacteroidales bacterium]|nr:bile acid:sodium symporter family protein [Bacteroidales bacterium]
MNINRIVSFISSNIAWIILAVSILAVAMPESFLWIPSSSINWFLGIIMFGMGLTLNLSDFRVVFTRPLGVFIGCAAQFSVMPLLAWGLCYVFNLPTEIAIGVVLVGCCPGGTASNVITYLADGDVALSVGMTGISTLLAPVLTPILTYALVGHNVDVDVASMLISVVQVVIFPIALGFVAKRYMRSVTDRLVSILPAFSCIAIATIIGLIMALNAQKVLSSGLLVMGIVILHNILGLVCGYLIGRLLNLEKPKRIAIAIEVGMQNSGLATSLANTHFATYPLATIPGAIFSVWHNLSGALIAAVLKHKKQSPTA